MGAIVTIAIRDQLNFGFDSRLSQGSAVYELYGITIRSEVPLPCPVRPSSQEADVAWDIRLGTGAGVEVDPAAALVSQRACDLPCHEGAMYSWIRRGATGSWFWWERAGICFVPASNDRVEVVPEPGYSLRALTLMLIGQVAGLMMARRGISSLHASAVVIDGKGVAFIAPPCHGKSTLAAGFVRQGASLLTDDVLPLVQEDDGKVVGWPSFPMMKVWRDTARHAFDLETEVDAGSVLDEKQLLTNRAQLRFAERPASLRAIYVVNRFDPTERGTIAIRSERLEPRAALAALIAQTYRGDILTPAEMAGILPLYARLAACAPVRLLSYPSGFDRQAATQAQILADLDAS